jgi:hypothetical protein
MKSNVVNDELKLSESDLIQIHAAFVNELARLRTPLVYDESRGMSLSPGGSNENNNNNNTELQMRRKRKQLQFNQLLEYEPACDAADLQTLCVARPCDMTSGKCHGQCTFYQPPFAANVFVCVRSGRIHYCTSNSCDALETTIEHRVCSITGFSYAHDVLLVLPTHNDLVDMWRRELIHPTPRALAKRKKQKTLADANAAQLLKQKQTNPSAPPPPPIVVIKKPPRPKHPKRNTLPNAAAVVSNFRTAVVEPINKSVDAPSVRHPQQAGNKPLKSEKLLCEARTFILDLMPSYQRSEAVRLASVCVNLWIRMMSTKYYESVKGRYPFKNHCAAVLYNAMDGIRYEDNFWLLEPEPFLYHMLPPAKMLKHHGVKPNKYTSSCVYFHEMGRELMSV